MSKEIQLNAEARLQGLVTKSFDTLETLLEDHLLPAQDRAMIATRILELSQSLSPGLESNLHAATVAKSVATTAPKKANAKTNSPVKTGKSFLVPIHCIQVDNFLTPDEHDALLQTALENEQNFADATVYRKDNTQKANNDVRQSVVLDEKSFPDIAQIFKNKLLEYVPSALEQLKLPLFTPSPSDITLQLTAHNDGCYYKMHSDAASERTVLRRLTYVYYFYQEPKAFSGGELRLFDTEFKNGKPLKREQFADVEPRNNRIIFF